MRRNSVRIMTTSVARDLKMPDVLGLPKSLRTSMNSKLLRAKFLLPRTRYVLFFSSVFLLILPLYTPEGANFSEYRYSTTLGHFFLAIHTNRNT